jgi:solute:Na+ symporter, SSS family
MAASLSFQSAVFPLSLDGLTVPGYAALYALGINFALSIMLSLVLNPIRAARGVDQTTAADYRF